MILKSTGSPRKRESGETESAERLCPTPGKTWYVKLLVIVDELLLTREDGLEYELNTAKNARKEAWVRRDRIANDMDKAILDKGQYAIDYTGRAMFLRRLATF